MTAEGAGRYAGLRGKRLALVESMLHDAFSDGIHAARALGCEIWLLIRDVEWYTAGRPFEEHPLAGVDRVVRTDTLDVEAVFEALTGPSGEALVDGVLSFSDYHTEVAAQVAERLGLPGPGAGAVAAANQKHLLREAFAGDPGNVRHRLVDDPAQLDEAAAALGFPLVAKPPAEAVSYGVRLVRDRSGLDEAYRELSAVRHSLRGQPRTGAVLLEEYVEGVEVSVESMTVDGVTRFYGVTSKDLLPPPSFLECAHSFPVPLPEEQWREVRACVTRVLAAIGYRRGAAHTELRLTPDGPRIIEVNPRLPAHRITTMIQDTLGVDPHLEAKLLALGGRPEPAGPSEGRSSAELRPGGAAVVVLYPDRPGRLLGVDGVERASRLPGVTISLHAEVGQALWKRTDNSAGVGFSYATGRSAADALATATAAAGLLTIRIQGTEPPDEQS
ncbi:argininosuccinate lyase [Kitasatospora herbaricolor]|uniref:ATP-grasp domain-containing protein n=1 Tax=Kitasatospora herbaricolor TaxID=68217 RepID=UPI00174C6369|nr:ATP-grasp domain-containing protein [Kitasatospora herbaricolor]MDQ0309533.1 biotin carboxylase [Kitasatospora herbaricolor]GGV01219.1 argininosuccinate lyase [Kitasatospora herbaricolor]